MADTTLSAEQVSGTEQPGAAASTEGQVAPEAPAETGKEGGLESLPEHWQAEVRKLRDENADRRTKYNEAMTKLDEAKSQEDIDKAVDEYRSQVGELERKLAFQQHTNGLPQEAKDLVTGSTDEEIKASADRVRALLEVAGKPEEVEPPKKKELDLEATGGLDPKASRSATSGLSPRELARAALSRR